ncbi:hypothetical protein LCGC14_2577070 [marine sediment metagenome]|uniref:Uncharacterized protein n=1 Tax=marine sediment metagenome TaxID=412755 RepID=A0A0F9D891_9ZZZZ
MDHVLITRSGVVNPDDYRRTISTKELANRAGMAELEYWLKHCMHIGDPPESITYCKTWIAED